MPETRLLAQHQPRTTTLPRAQIANNPGNVAGSYISASPAAGGQVHAQVAAARQAATAPPGGRPPGSRPQDARVEVFPRPGSGAAPAHGGALLATNQRPTVQIIPKVGPSAVQAQIPPGGGVPFALDEAMLVGQLLHQFIEASADAKDHQNAQLGSSALGKVSANVQLLMEMMAQAQAVQAQQSIQMQQVQHAPAPPALTPTRVQVPAHPTSPPQPAIGGGPGPGAGAVAIIGQQPNVQILPNQIAPPAAPAPVAPQAWQGWQGSPGSIAQPGQPGQHEGAWVAPQPPPPYAQTQAAPVWGASQLGAPSGQVGQVQPVVVPAWPPGMGQGQALPTPGVFSWPPRPATAAPAQAPVQTAAQAAADPTAHPSPADSSAPTGSTTP